MSNNPSFLMPQYRGTAANDYLLLLGGVQPVTPKFGAVQPSAATAAFPVQLQALSVQPVQLQFDSPQYWAQQQPWQSSRQAPAPVGLGDGLPSAAENQPNGGFVHQFMFTLYQIILDLLKFINENLFPQQQGQQQQHQHQLQLNPQGQGQTTAASNLGLGGLQVNRTTAVPALLFQGQRITEPDGTAGLPGAVAANERARAYGDPHIEGGDGERFDFNEKGIFNLLEDSNVSLNAEMGPAAGEASVITNAGLKLGGQSVQIKPSGEIVIDGKPHQLRDGQSITLRDGSHIVKQGNNTKVSSQEYDMTFTQRANNQYLDVAVQTRAQGVFADGVMPIGILGETFDADKATSPNTKHHAETYRRDNLFS